MAWAVNTGELHGLRELLEEVREMNDIMEPTNGRFVRAWRRMLERWRAAAVKRVPVDNSTLKQNILSEWFWRGSELYGAVGTNIPYGVYVEFGTKFIAKGAVLALGTRARITDAQSVHTWAAKEGDAIETTSASYHKHSEDDRLLRNRSGQWIYKSSRGLKTTDNFDKALKSPGGPQEQMPWLRASFTEEEFDMVEDLKDALRRPGSGGVAA